MPRPNHGHPKVFAESWQLRSQLKADIRVQVRNLRTLFPDGLSCNPEAQQTATRDIISVWVADGSYLHDVVPGSVSARACSPFFRMLTTCSRTPRSTLVTPSSCQRANRFTSTSGQTFQRLTVIHSMGQFLSHLWPLLEPSYVE